MENYCLNKYWLIGLGVIVIIFLVLVFVYDFMFEICFLMDLIFFYWVEFLIMICSNGICDLIFMLFLVGVMNVILGFFNVVICVFVGFCYGLWIGFLVNWVGNILGNCVVVVLLLYVKFFYKFK